jgi:AraC-like DNA-binding protein
MSKQKSSFMDNIIIKSFNSETIPEISAEYKLVFILSGNTKFKVNKLTGSIAGMQVLTLNHSQSIELQPEKKVQGIYIGFPSSFFDQDLSMKKILFDSHLFEDANFKLYNINGLNHARINMLLDLLIQDYQEAPQKNEVIKSYLKLLLLKINDLKKEKCEVPKEIYDKDYETYLIFRELLEKNYSKNMASGDFAEIMKISVRKLNSVVNKYTQKSPCIVISDKMIAEAKWRLLHTNMNIKEIAYQLGFEDPLYFSRFFKKHVDTAPEQFRSNVVLSM